MAQHLFTSYSKYRLQVDVDIQACMNTTTISLKTGHKIAVSKLLDL